MTDYSEAVVYKYKANYYQRNNQKHNCVCGGKYTTISKAIHCKTKKHITFIEKK